MGEPRRRRLVVAVTPLVLEGALAAILDRIALDEVVQYHAATASERQVTYDAAIVTPDLEFEIVAHVVIALPDTGDGTGVGAAPGGHLTVDGEVDAAYIHDQREVIELLDAHVPAPASRQQRLASTGLGAA